jgi:hypothetical protein
VVFDASGNAVRRLNAANASGFQRIAWDLRYPAPSLPPEAPSEGDEDVAAQFRPQAGGPLVMPGKYVFRLFRKANGVVTEVGQAQTFNVVADTVAPVRPQDRQALAEFQLKVAKLYRAVSGSVRTGEEMKTRLKAIRRALNETPTANPKLSETADRLDRELNDFMRVVRGDVVLAARNENVAASISDRVQNIMGGQRFAIQRPTQTHVDNYAIAAQQFGTELAKLRQMVDVDLRDLEKQMEAAGAPWTPGRVPEWKE